MTDDRPSTLDLLHQSEIWIDADGNTHQIPDMEIRHARNVIRLLERKAAQIHDAESWDYVSGPGPSGDVACDAFEAEMERFMSADPLEWVRSTDLVQALYQRIGEPVPGAPAPDDPDWSIPEDATYDGPPDWMNEDLPEEDPEFGHPASRYSTDQAGGAHVVVQRTGWYTNRILRYSHPQAARDAADYLNTLTRWEIT